MNSGERDWVLKEQLNSPNNGGLTPLAMILDFAGQLESRGIDFIFVPIPAKTEVYPDYWVRTIPADLHVAPMSRRMLYDLSKANIEVIDLLPDFLKVRDEFKDTLYLGQNADHHWTFSGSKYAASLIAERLKRYDFVQAAMRTGERFKLEESTFNTGIRRLACWRVFDAQGKLYEDADDSPILVVGDSNIRLGGVKGGNLTAYLAAELGIRSSIYQVDAFQPSQLNLASSELFKNRKVVIYVGLMSLLHDSSITLKPVYLP